MWSGKEIIDSFIHREGWSAMRLLNGVKNFFSENNRKKTTDETHRRGTTAIQNNSDIEFLNHFPHLTDWLNINGYTLIYTYRDEYEQIHSTWSDRTSAPIENGCTDARNWITIVYCEHCGVVDIYKRVAVCAPDDDELLVNELDALQNNADEDSVVDALKDDDEQYPL